jgi:hypothetical protein
MKGIIFTLLEEYIVQTQGDEAFEELLESTPLVTTEPFVGPGSYPDEDLHALLAHIVERSGAALSNVLRGFGRFCIPRLVVRFPAFFAGHRHPRTFLLTVSDFHELEVRKLFDDASPPRFEYIDPGPDGLIMRYRSRRQMCHLVEGLIAGVADHFATSIAQRQTSCMAEGALACEFELGFPTGGAR